MSGASPSDGCEGGARRSRHMSRGPMSIRFTQDRFVYGQFTVQSDSTTESQGLSSFVITTVSTRLQV